MFKSEASVKQSTCGDRQGQSRRYNKIIRADFQAAKISNRQRIKSRHVFHKTKNSSRHIFDQMLRIYFV